MALAATFH